MKEFNEAYQKVITEKAYQSFLKKTGEKGKYYLAHGFLQLNAEFKPKTTWQIGFYSKKKDKLAVFETNPVTLIGKEDAFKEKGIINELKLPILPTSQAIQTLKELLQKEYSSEQATSTILIVQNIGGQAIYNLTVVTKTFSLLLIHINAITGKVVSHEKRSILDLKKKD